MQTPPLKRLEMSERQAKVMEMYHQGMTYREIAKVVKVSHQTVANDINATIAYFQQQAVDFYADWLAKELSLTVHGQKLSARAYEVSSKQQKKGKRVIAEEAPDARHSREMREWQARRLELLGLVRETSKPVIAPVIEEKTNEQPTEPVTNPVDDLAPYAEAVEQLRKSLHGQGGPNAPPASAPKPVHPIQANSPPGPVPAP